MNEFTPLPKTPRTGSLRGKLTVLSIEEWVDNALELCTTLEQEVGVASSGWLVSEKDNIHLTGDNDKLRKILFNVRKALNNG